MRFKNILNTVCYSLLIVGIFTLALVACGNTSSVKSDYVKVGFQKDSSVAKSNPLSLIAELNIKIKETSGLAVLGDVLITHNDKGRSNELMLIHPGNGNLIQSVTISNLQNNDWEDLAKNEEYLFIGDMGNNEGERKNLAIHTIPLKEISKNIIEVKSNGSINFNYPEQNEFDVSKKHNYDCEAILCYQNQIYLFTKNRLDDKTNLYVLPNKPGNYGAKFIDSFDVGGRITGADVSPDGKKIALVGYNKKSDCFLWTFDGFKGDNFFKGNSKKYTLGQYAQLGQMEGITFKDNSNVYLSSEEIANVHASLYLYSLD